MTSEGIPPPYDSALPSCVSMLILEFKVMRDEFQALKATQQLSGAAPSSSGAATVPTKKSTAIPMAAHSGAGTEGFRKRRQEPSSDENADANSTVDEGASGPFELSKATGEFWGQLLRLSKILS